MIETSQFLRFLIDEDLSPAVAKYVCENLLGDAVHIRDRNLLGLSDREIFDYAFKDERILITANIRDFEKIIQQQEIHAGMIFIQDGDLLRAEQIELVRDAIDSILYEIQQGKDMINRVLYVSRDGLKQFKYLSC